MATQAEIDALSEKLGTVGTQLVKGLGEVQTEIANLRNQIGDSVDITALSEKVDALIPVAQALDDVVPDVVDVEPEPVEPEGNPTENV